MRIILLGCPGAGKDTQAKRIIERYPMPQISTGEILRHAIQSGSSFGKEVEKIVMAGQLVADEMITRLVFDRIGQADCEHGFLLDGFPRTITQAEALHAFIEIDYVIDIAISEQEALERLGGRRIHPASGRTYHLRYHPPLVADQDDISGEPLVQRPDDHEDIIRKRLAVYQTLTMPLRQYYFDRIHLHAMKKPVYLKIDGSSTPEIICEEIFAALA